MSEPPIKLSQNPVSKRMGLQARSNVRRLPPPIAELELTYLNLRDAYAGLVQKKTDAELALEIAKELGNTEEERHIRNRIHRIDSRLHDYKKRVNEAALKAWSENFLLVARLMLPEDTMQLLAQETTRLMGRPMTELK